MICRGRQSNRRASALVELAIVLPVLLLLLLGSIELGLMLRAQNHLLNLGRAAARAAAAGEAEAVIWQRFQQAAPGIDLDRLSMQLEVRNYTGAGEWDPVWRPLYDDGENNGAAPNSLIRVTLEYHYRLLVPRLFPFLVDNPADGTRTLRVQIVMPRT